MSSFDARVTIPWADGDHVFRLDYGRLLELQELTDAGPLELFVRINQGRWRVQDLRETIRLGLVGGGMDPGKAIILVRRYVEGRPLAESVAPALEILQAAIAIPEEMGPGKPPATEETGASPPPLVMEPAPSSDLDQMLSTE